MSTSENKGSILVPTSIKKAVEEAKKTILEERKQLQKGLKVRWEKLNIANRKYFRFAQIYLFAGLSGSGKSYILNSIINDFYDKDINNGFKENFIVLYFSFEMSAVDEVLRTTGNKTGISYGELLSSEFDKDSQDYKTLEESKLEEVFSMMDLIANRPIIYFENAGKLSSLYATCEYYANKYPNAKLVVAIDHTLLSLPEENEDVITLMSNTARTVIGLKKNLGAMVLMLGQLNNKIEEYVRIKDPRGHYPIKSDIYAQGQLYNACDTVITSHQPSMLKIAKYGTKKIPTNNLIHLQYLKARHGKVGSIWLRNNLSNGTIDELNLKEILETPTDTDGKGLMKNL